MCVGVFARGDGEDTKVNWQYTVAYGSYLKCLLIKGKILWM